MKRPSILFLILLLLCSTNDYVRGEDGAVDAEDDDNYMNNQGDENANAQIDDYVYVQRDDDAYVSSQIQVCSDAVIQVLDIVTYCDSPGTFYYGSGKYRNNKYCMPGDKGTVAITIYIAYNELIQQSGNYALVDVYADGFYEDGSSVESAVTIYDNADLCSLSSLSSLKRKGRTQCPYNGYYVIKTHFYWSSAENGEVFTPTVHVGFKSNVKTNVYDFGGANTDLCRGSSFLTWSSGVRVTYANAIGNFMKSFGILLMTTMFMGVLVWFLSNRPRSIREAKAQLMETKSKLLQSKLGGRIPFSKFNFGKFGKQTHKDASLVEDEEFDFRKIQTAGKNDLMDF